MTRRAHCKRCGEHIAEHRKLCDECRKVAFVSQQSLDWIEDQLRSIERLIACLHGQLCSCCRGRSSSEGKAFEDVTISCEMVGMSVLPNRRGQINVE